MPVNIERFANRPPPILPGLPPTQTAPPPAFNPKPPMGTKPAAKPATKPMPANRPAVPPPASKPLPKPSVTPPQTAKPSKPAPAPPPVKPLPGPGEPGFIPTWFRNAHAGQPEEGLATLWAARQQRVGAAPPPAAAAPPQGGPGTAVPPPPGAAPPQNPFSPPPQPPSDINQFGTGAPGETPAPYAFNDPFASFMAAVPLMNLNAEQQISQAMASAGFGPQEGNRWGSFAAGKAGEIGAQNALAQNQLFLKTLSDYANQTEDRALQASGLGLQAGSLLDQIAQNQIKLPFQIAGYEQGRQDDFSQQVYRDFEANKLGWLPMLLQAAMSQGSGSPGQIYSTTEPGSPGAADWLGLLSGLFG